MKDIHSKHQTKKVKLSTESVKIDEHISKVRNIRNILAQGPRDLVTFTDNNTTNEYELFDVEDSKYFRGMNSLYILVHCALYLYGS